MLKQEHSRLVYTGKVKASERDFYGTPSEWIEAARKVMGRIELDPASCYEANEQIVKADRFFDESDDALLQSWEADTLFLNPPYGRTLKHFAEKFYQEWSKLAFKQAIVLINNTTETKPFDLFSRCAQMRAETKKRIQFVSVEGRSNQNSNTRGQVFFYCGHRVKLFTQVFKSMNCRILQEV